VIIVAHMIGDYFIQNSWMAANKTKSWLPCFVHCFLYTLAVLLVCRWFDYRLIIVFVTHYAMDRWRLAAIWRRWFSGDQELPWVITADNSIHLLILLILSGVTW